MRIYAVMVSTKSDNGRRAELLGRLYRTEERL